MNLVLMKLFQQCKPCPADPWKRACLASLYTKRCWLGMLVSTHTNFLVCKRIQCNSLIYQCRKYRRMLDWRNTVYYVYLGLIMPKQLAAYICKHWLQIKPGSGNSTGFFLVNYEKGTSERDTAIVQMYTMMLMTYWRICGYMYSTRTIAS